VAFTGTVIDLIHSNHIHQAIEVADLIRTTSEVEGASNHGLNGLRVCLDMMNKKLEDLSKEALKDLSKAKREILSSVTIMNIEVRNFLADIVIPSCESYGYPLGF
jgi:hypothetical protein